MRQQPYEFVSIHTVANRFEADLLMDALEKEQIPAILRTFEETPYDGLFIPQKGWGNILVTKDMSESARSIIDRLLQDLEEKRLYTDPAEIDPLLWEKLEEADPQEICVNAQIRFDQEQNAYVVPFLNSTFLCFPGRRSIQADQPTFMKNLSFQFYLVMLHYLLDAQNIPLSPKWISEKDLPGGQLFFQGPHAFPVDPLLKLFGRRPEVFPNACKALGGTPVDMGDSGYRLWPFPRIPLIFVLWHGDDEFEPALHIRFNTTIDSHLANLDTIWALVNVVCKNLTNAAQSLIKDEEEKQALR